MKYYGSVGYVQTVEVEPGIWEEVVTKRDYSGDVLRFTSKISSSNPSVNDSFDVNNQLSIIADPFAYSNFHSIRFVEWLGSQWKVTNIEVQFPRLILTVGGLYNGNEN